ncbi:lysozyme [Phormidesmis priestleyi ULC007]|uniref:Lysozyme n=1 Tax=Phormidesmis priestleyi ULC007 TaxID=1920490 RepID=A0A2T1D8Q7_9CYAN|nr:lysozyme [Phormidesmis priestleyi]PSB16889.1 lysozyme [Phormidesmis priestleyi ULC007]PZO47813.1 MAG: lysozyme [Phormidesmis priestleyi]
MATVTTQGLDRSSLSEKESHALDILVNLPVDKFNTLKQRLELDVPGVVGRTTLDKFIQFCDGKGLDFSANGVSAFKAARKLGDSGVLKGVIGPQTAGIYFDVLMATQAFSSQSRRINQAGLDLIKEFEGYHRGVFQSGPQKGQSVPDGNVTAYFDPVGVATIGFGNIDSVKPSDVDIKVITLQEAEDLLRRDLATAEDAVSELITVPLDDNQFAALVSFTFNLGAGTLEASTLRKLLNDEDYQGAADQILRFVFGGGEALPGLVRRRTAERKLFLSP